MKRIVPMILLLCVPMGVAGCYNYTGANKEAAEKNAKTWLKQMGYEDAPFTCNKHDSDLDGYVSCSVNLGGEFVQIECAGEDFIDRNTGCRAPKLKLPAPSGGGGGGGSITPSTSSKTRSSGSRKR